jgi:ABC-type uncharacterized transport system fused permease/ATPase subunit
MTIFNTVRQACALASPYFSPSQGNWLRVGSLVGSVVIHAFHAQYNEAMRSHIYTAFDFFNEKRPIEEFDAVLRSALLRGFASVFAVDMASSFLQEYVDHSFENAMSAQTLKRWLKDENYQGLKAVDCTTSHNVPTLLADKIPKFTSTSVKFVTQRIGDLASTIFSLYRLYHLSKPLFSKSIQFPFNCQGGVFAVIIGLLGLFAWVKVRSQEGVEHSHDTLDHQQREVFRRITSLERNALTVAAFPLEYKNNILNDIQVKARNTLTSVTTVAMHSFFNTNLTYMFPQMFELFIVYVASLFAKADPAHFDYKESFLPLLRESVHFMWRSTNIIQTSLSDLVGYYKSIKKINEFYEKISIYEQQKAASASNIKKGDTFSIERLTGKGTTDKGEETLFSQLDLKTEPGHLYFVRGVNGSGKTVLLKTIAGLHPFAQGTITVPENVWYLQPKVEIEPAFETFGSLLSKTFGVKNPEDVQKVTAYLQKFGLFYSNERDWSTLSEGKKQILHLAVILTMMEKVKTPWLILVDEMLFHIDNIAPRQGELSTRGVVLDLLKKLANGSLFQTRHTILIVDHNDSGMQCDGENEIKTSTDAQFKIYKQK